MTTTPLPPAIALALQCGAARFYPEAQAERGDAYLVGRQFLERFYGQARADLEAENKRLRGALQRIESMCAAPPNFSDATIQELDRAALGSKP